MAEGLNILNGYLQSDTDGSSTSVQYYGYLAPNCAWYIMQISISTGISNYRYFAGSGLSNYETNWTNRTGLSYDYFSNIFQNT
jgi:hypothetical protein